MTARSHITENTKKQPVSTALAQGMFQSRPFVVQPQTEEQSQQPDLKTELQRAERYGHRLDRIASIKPPVQAKLTIGQPGDRYEQEADRVAARVVNQIHAPTAQRQEMPEEDELQMKPEIGTIQRETMADRDEELQMKPSGGGMTAAPDLEASIQQARGSGQPLADSIREPMEQAFGADFSSVKVHTDTQSDRLNRSIQAKAFTTGQDVFFRQGEYNPGSRGGQELLAHELTHVVQQSGEARTVQRAEEKEKIVEGGFYLDHKLGNSNLAEYHSVLPPRENNPQVYFRAMNNEEYAQLSTTGHFNIADSYQGISPSFQYVKKYFGKNNSHYIVEFLVTAKEINLKSEFKYAGTGEKAEAGVMSLGLGSKATPSKSGEKAAGGEYFMYLLKSGLIKWRLVRYIGSKPPKR